MHGAHVLEDPWVGGSQALINPPKSQGLIREHSSSFTGIRYTGSTKTKTETCSNMFIKPNNLIQVQSNGFFSCDKALQIATSPFTMKPCKVNVSFRAGLQAFCYIRLVKYSYTI